MCWQLSLALTFLLYIYCSSWAWETHRWNETHILSNKSKSSWLECDKLYSSLKTKQNKKTLQAMYMQWAQMFSEFFLVEWGALVAVLGGLKQLSYHAKCQLGNTIFLLQNALKSSQRYQWIPQWYQQVNEQFMNPHTNTILEKFLVGFCMKQNTV